MIYLASDDNYFILGAKAMFNSVHKDVTLIDVVREKELIDKMHFTGEDILLIVIEQADTITSLLTAARRHGAKVLLVMDNASDSIQSVLSKKMPLDDLLRLLETDMTYLDNLLFLTRQEIKVMRGLTFGKTPNGLAKEFNLSVKTICGHKVNALKKLGLNHLNARSIFIFDKIFQGLSAY